MRVTLKSVNDQLQSMGSGVKLEKGDGYYYFTSGEAAGWLNPTVRVQTLSALSMEEWIAKFQELKKLNESLSGEPKTTAAEPKPPKQPRRSRK